ncbi:MAG: DsbA family protein [Candidatus Kerfeldbacteria bacterium]|nr:DsbA family protein [Candidatus Kerfeldbacteria bacterium]
MDTAQHDPVPRRSLFDGASSKLTMLLGLSIGVATLSLLGFVIVLVKLLGSDGAAASTGTSVASTTTAPSPVAPTPTSPTPSAALPEAPSGPVAPIADDDHVRGGDDPQVYLIEYSDFECPFCKRFHPTMQQALTEYGDRVAWVYRHFPLNIHANAQKEAEAAECANELGGNDAFWTYTDKIFERTTSNGTGLALDALAPLAGELGLDQGKFQECLDSVKFAAHVTEDYAEGTTAGVNGTPATFLVKKDGTSQLLSGALPYAQVKQAIDQALQ